MISLHLFIQIKMVGIKHSGLSQSRRMLGEVASWTEMNTRNEIRQPARPNMP